MKRIIAALVIAAAAGVGFAEGASEASDKPVTITLMDVSHKPIMTWSLEGALPIKWTGPQLKSDSNAVAIQSLDLVCNDVTVKVG